MDVNYYLRFKQTHTEKDGFNHCVLSHCLLSLIIIIVDKNELYDT